MNYRSAKKKRLIETIKMGCSWNLNMKGHVYQFQSIDANGAVIDEYITNSGLDCFVFMVRIIW